MTKPNSASSNPQPADLSRDILDKVNAHADRSIDRLFADIDELFKDDVAQDNPPPAPDRPFQHPYFNSPPPFTDSPTSFAPSTPDLDTPFTPPTPPSTEADTPFTPPVLPNYFQTPIPPAEQVATPEADTPFISRSAIRLGNVPAAELPQSASGAELPNYFQTPIPQNQPPANFSPQAPVQSQLDELENTPEKSGFPLWAKVFLSIGLISIASSSLLLWLIKERKISLPSNINTSWITSESKSQISTDDAKFADYMRKSISKIESANTQTTVSNNPIPTQVDSANVAIPEPTTPVETAPAPTGTSLKTTVSLLKTMQSGDRIGATFQIGKRAQTINVGDKIGKTGWSLLTVAENSIVVVKAGRENKSIAIGQKF